MYMKKMHGVTIALVMVLSLLQLHCEHVGPLELEPEPSGRAPAFSDIQTVIFNTNCALSGCHVGTNALLGLDLSDGRAHAHLVNIKSREAPTLFLVNPGKPDSSYLVIKLEGSVGMAPGTIRMPIGRSPLSDEDITLVRDWIAGGAQND